MPYVPISARRELSEFYPPPYNFLAPKQSRVYIVRRRGMGQGTSGTIAQAAGTGASAIGATGGLLTAAGVLQAVPVAGQIAGAALAITAVIAGLFKGCGQTCVLSSNEANQVGNYMTQNLNQYLAAPVSAQTQAEALANFDQLWQALVNYCSQPSLGSASQRCISDRAQGSCAYKAAPGGWVKDSSGNWTYKPWGPNGSGTSCWNYFVGMRDPIANDPRVSEVAAVATNVLAQKIPAPVTAATPTGAMPMTAPSAGVLPAGLSNFLVPGLLIGGGLLLLLASGDGSR